MRSSYAYTEKFVHDGVKLLGQCDIGKKGGEGGYDLIGLKLG